MRSGDIHACVQHDFIFHGQVVVWILQADGSTNKTLYSQHDYISIPSYTPHIFEFITDTILAEWWDGPFQAWYYEPFRNIVEHAYSSTTFTPSKTRGSFSIYKLVPESPACSSISTTWQEKIQSLLQKEDHLLLWTGMAIGLSLGYLFGTRRRR
jgi:hypothetical protein